MMELYVFQNELRTLGYLQAHNSTTAIVCCRCTPLLERKFQLMNLPVKSITLQTQRSPDLLAGFKRGALRQRGDVEKETGSKKGRGGREKERREERERMRGTCSIASRGNRRPWLHINYSFINYN